MKTRWYGAAVLVMVTAVTLGLIGAAHTPAGGGLWARVTGKQCPFGATQPTAVEAQAELRERDAALRGADGARERPAMGLDLGRASRESFAQWVQLRGGRCTSQASMLGIECSNVQLQISALPAATVFARFDTVNHLREVAIESQVTSARQAAEAVNALVRTVTERAGKPFKETGERNEAYLARATLAQAATEFRFADYYARLSATNLGGLGYSISQTYRALD